MFLKNYTSEVPVSQTLASIEKVLIQCGVSSISKEYSATGGKVFALIFSIEAAQSQHFNIRLPVDEEAALQALWLDYVGTDTVSSDGKMVAYCGKSGNKRKRREDFRQQAERTAWRIMLNWVEVQMSMIQMKQADFVQVFLPYVWDSRNRRTYYQAIKDSGLNGLLPETT